MTAHTPRPLPNVRKLFIPDPGYVMIDADLKGADAVVVAAEANDTKWLKAFADGLDLHTLNATEMYGERFTALEGPARRAMRQRFKVAAHATNYGAQPRTLHFNPSVAFSMAEANWFQDRWFRLHPGIKDWHNRTQHQLSTSRSVSNRFGYRILYFDRIEGLLPQALAWLPQSTVAETCFRGAIAVEERFPFVEMLLQVHDSVVFQIPERHYTPQTVTDIRSTLHIPIPYPEPLTIKWKVSASRLSWGDCEEIAA